MVSLSNPHQFSAEVEFVDDHRKSKLFSVTDIDIIRVAKNVLQLGDVEVCKVVHGIV